VSALASLGAASPPKDPAEVTRRILTQARFRIYVHAAPRHTWWDAVRQWLSDRWSQLVDAFAHHVHVSRSAGATFGDMLVGVAILIVVVFGVRLFLGIAKEGASAGRAGHALPEHTDPGELHAAALDAARNARYAAAIALLFRAALAALDARGVLRDDPARTVNECRADVRAHAAALSTAFDSIARAFTAAVYAEDRVSDRAWSDARDAYADLTRAQSDAA
jgi:hypothetical protein